MEDHDLEIVPERILGIQRLEDLFNHKGYLICQATGNIIYNFEQVAAVFIPLSATKDQVMVVHQDYAVEFLQSHLSFALKEINKSHKIE
ncbi:hypothetical protein [Desulfosporosinus sp. FKA]|uniref:hypothetical protein n=1 Tax=Desulfosporosinus sp. FKA TaxID=1969834 RepID=UPI000B4A462F|nr:hypothetical protein [Desulfosporosinus sp. FKA]